MDKLISELERIIDDVIFSGTNEIGADICARIEYAGKLCTELEMETGKALCARLNEYAAENNSRQAAEIICKLCCYTECLRNMS